MSNPLGDELVLTPPEPVAVVPAEKASHLIPIDDTVRAELDKRAASYVDSVAAMDPRSPEFTTKISDIASLGDGEVRASANVTNRMLERSVSALAGAKGEAADSQQRVAKNLLELRRTVEDLDPADSGRAVRKFISKLPFGNKLRDLVARYQSANANINRIVAALRGGQDELRRDNAAIQGERARLWETMKKLQEYTVLAQALDAAVEQRITEIEMTDPDKANSLRADVLFPVRQKHQDLLVQLAICAQGYLAMDVVRRNNDELIKGVDRASATTVSALRIAVTIAQALSNQKMVIEQVTALKGTTEDIIARNAAMLAAQSGDIQKISADPAVSVQTLQQAFTQIYRTLDSIDEFRGKATQSMATTVAALDGELRKATPYLERSHRNELEQ